MKQVPAIGDNTGNSANLSKGGSLVPHAGTRPFRRIYEVHTSTARNLIKDRERQKRAETVSAEMGELFKPRDSTQGSLIAALSAQSLGWIIQIGDSQINEFWESTRRGIGVIFEDPSVMQALVISKIRGRDPTPKQVEAKISRMLKYSDLAEEHRAGCLLIAEMAALQVPNKDYGELFMRHIEDGTFSVPALVANILDIARNGIPEKMEMCAKLETARTAYTVLYPIAETLALGAEIIERTRMAALVNMLELEGKVGRFGTLELYDKCANGMESIAPFAQWAETDLGKFFEGTNKAEGIMTKISRAKKINVEMSSPTVDPKGVFRIKGLSGAFRKICERREAGELGENGGEFGFGDLKDIVACTCTVGGDLEESREVAQKIIAELVSKYKGNVKGFEMDDKERPTGYIAPHITFKLRVRIGKDEMWVPIDVQVRPESVQRKCLDLWSRGFKISNDITREVVARVQEDIGKIAGSLRAKDSEPPQNEIQKILVKISGGSGGEKRFAPKQEICGKPGWRVASAVARIKINGGKNGMSEKMLAFTESVSVESMDGETLGLFEEVPKGGIKVKLLGGEGPQIRTCKELLKADLGDSEVKEMLKRRIGQIKENRRRNK